MKARVLIVDDHEMIRHGLRLLIGQAPDLCVAAEALDEAGAIQAVENATPDLAIIDLSLGATDGLDLTRKLRARYAFPILVMSGWDESCWAERALAAGAQGYVMKDRSFEEALTAIRVLLGGANYVSEAVKNRRLTQ